MEHQAAIETNAVERYLLGEMPAEEREAFEEHYFSCIECAEEVRAGAQIRANWEGADRIERPAAPERSWWSWLRWPSLIPVTASLLFAGVVWRQASHQPILRSNEEYLVHETERGEVEHNVSMIPRGDGSAEIRFVIPVEAPPPPYECTLTDSAGKTVATTTIKGRGNPEASVELRRDRLLSGLYNLILRSDGNPVAQYTFHLQ